MPRRLALTLALVAALFLSSACQSGDGGIEVCNKRKNARCWVIYP
jgi:hypothetical protein